MCVLLFVSGFLPDDIQLSAFTKNRNGFLQASSNSRAYRQCKNHKEYEVCNWMVPFEDENELFSSCRLTQTIPNLDNPENKVLWYRI